MRLALTLLNQKVHSLSWQQKRDGIHVFKTFPPGESILACREAARSPPHPGGVYRCEGSTMLTFLLGLSLGACIGAAAIGICLTSYEHEAESPPGQEGAAL